MRFPLLACGAAAALALTFASPAPAQAATGWIGDTIYVPVRAGAGNGFRIVHRGLRSGAQVEILQWDSGADWVHIRGSGVDGWVEAQYMSREPIARQLLEKAQQRAKELEASHQTLRQQLSDMTRERDALATDKRSLNDSLSERNQAMEQLQQVAADPLRLDQANRKLNEELSLLRTELDQVRAENSLLRNDRTYRGWLFALLTVFSGVALGWYFKSRASRQRNSWV